MPWVEQQIRERQAVKAVPQLNSIKSICKLATLKCHYNNIAKSTKAPGTGLMHVGEKERSFWIKYSGVAEISFDVEKILMEQNGTDITITLPPPNVKCTPDPDSFDNIQSEDAFFKKNPITASDQTAAISKAEKNMATSVRNNRSIISTAEAQAQELIENYIVQIGSLTGTEYHITWASPS